MSEKIFPGEYFRKWVEDKNISKTEISDKIGVSRQQVYVYFDAANLSRKIVKNIADKLEVKISDIWPDEYRNAELVGDFDSRGYGKKTGVNNFIDLANGMALMITPLIEEYAQAGFLTGFANQSFLEDLPNHSIVVDRFHKGKYYSFRVIGDSMDNGTTESIVSGSIVTGREIKKELWNSRFHINKFKDYVIVHKEGILVKRIIEHKVEDGIIICRSLNPDKSVYPDYELNLDDCSMILNIVNVSVSR